MKYGSVLLATVTALTIGCLADSPTDPRPTSSSAANAVLSEEGTSSHLVPQSESSICRSYARQVQEAEGSLRMTLTSDAEESNELKGRVETLRAIISDACG
jgi:hypothetical protein